MSTQRFGSLAAAGLAATIFAGGASANLINEFEPNPAGTDPATTTFEFKGTVGASFSGFLTYIDTDGGQNGALNGSDAVSGTYDANGLATVSVSDLENPSVLVVFSTLAPAGDIDANDDDIIDDLSAFGTIYDAINVIDNTGDTSPYTAQLGGEEFATANEWEIAFRDGTTDDWYGVDTFTEIIYDIDGTEYAAGDFDFSPLSTTNGAVNPSLVPEPASFALIGLGGLAMLGRRR